LTIDDGAAGRTGQKDAMTRRYSHGSEMLDFIRAALRLLFLMNVALLAVAFFFLDESDSGGRLIRWWRV
jgi:hypothetical protein